MPETASIPNESGEIINPWNIEIFRARSSGAGFSMFQVYRQFLDAHRTEFNRALHGNPENMHFQTDPFTDSMQSDGIDITLEGVPIGQLPPISNAISFCDGNSALEQLKEYQTVMGSHFGAVCNGLESGPANGQISISHSPVMVANGNESAILHDYGMIPALIKYIHQLCNITFV
jgi:hypothetical protein